MIESKYKEREFLSEYTLDIDLFKLFGLDVLDIVPVRKVYIVVTPKGEYILKRLDYNKEKSIFIHEALKYVRDNGFKRVLNFIPSINNNICENYKDQIYCVMELVQGKESSYTNPIDVKLSVQGIAGLHKASKGYRTTQIQYDYRNKLKNNYNNKIDEILDIKDMVNHFDNKNEFDTLFINSVDKFLDKAFSSLKYLDNIDYDNMVLCDDKVALCHQDLAYHNILINDYNAYFIDFDYAIVDLKVQDLANYIMKVIKNFGYSMDKCEYIINEYKKNYVLYDDEIELLYDILIFPSRVFTLIRNYYYKEKSWEYNVFLNRFKDKLLLADEEQEFFDSFKLKYGI